MSIVKDFATQVGQTGGLPAGRTNTTHYINLYNTDMDGEKQQQQQQQQQRRHNLDKCQPYYKAMELHAAVEYVNRRKNRQEIGLGKREKGEGGGGGGRRAVLYRKRLYIDFMHFFCMDTFYCKLIYVTIIN